MATATPALGSLNQPPIWVPATTTEKKEEPVQVRADSNPEKALAELKLADATRKSLEEKFTPKSLSQELREETMGESHKQIRENPFLNQLIKGEFNVKSYLEYLGCLEIIHMPLEKAQKAIESKYGSQCFIYPMLYRAEHIKKDIAAWALFSSESVDFAKLAREPAREMAKRITELTEKEPLYAVGISYALYGGLLSGGQKIREGVAKKFQQLAKDLNNLEPHCGYSLYAFNVDIAEFTKGWKMNLDKVPATANIQNIKEFTEKLRAQTRLALSNELQFIAQLSA